MENLEHYKKNKTNNMNTERHKFDFVQLPSIEDVLNLPHTSYLTRYELPEIPAIYFLVVQNTIIYIGQTTNIKDRWKSHSLSLYIKAFFVRTNIMENINCDIYYADYSGKKQSDLVKAEDFMIKLFQPPLNQLLIYNEAKKRAYRKKRINNKKAQLVEISNKGINEHDDRLDKHLRDLPIRKLRVICQHLKISHYSYMTVADMITSITYLCNSPDNRKSVISLAKKLKSN